jgi:hypothetical protein
MHTLRQWHDWDGITLLENYQQIIQFLLAHLARNLKVCPYKWVL